MAVSYLDAYEAFGSEAAVEAFVAAGGAGAVAGKGGATSPVSDYMR